MVRRRIVAFLAAARGPGLGVLIAFAFAACTPMLAPHGFESASPSIEKDAFVARDGVKLPLRHWDASDPRAVIVALHGMSDYSEAFDMPGPWWAAHGIEVYAYDQRGFGFGPNPGLWGGAETMRADLSDFVEAVRSKYPGVPVYALGESMGGAVVLSSLADEHPPRVDGVILVAPAVWSRKDMPFIYTTALWIGAHTFPWLHVSGEGLKIWPSDNIAMLRKLSRDPVYQHDARIDQVYGLVKLMDEAKNAPLRLDADPPILFLYGDKDQVIPHEPTRQVIAALGNRATVLEYPKGYHMLLRDLEGETVWKDVADWIEKSNGKAAASRPPGNSHAN